MYLEGIIFSLRARESYGKNAFFFVKNKTKKDIIQNQKIQIDYKNVRLSKMDLQNRIHL